MRPVAAITLTKAGTYIVAGMQQFYNPDYTHLNFISCEVTTDPNDITLGKSPTIPDADLIFPGNNSYEEVSLAINGFYTVSGPPVTLYETCQSYGSVTVQIIAGTLTAIQVQQ